MTILVTGAAGFIGFHVARSLARRGDGDGHVLGIDNFTPYYLPRLKQARADSLAAEPGAAFETVDFSHMAALEDLARRHRITQVIHLGAQPGVRHSLDHPHVYAQSNLVGHLNILEFCRHHVPGGHLVYASSSSVYGGASELPFTTDQRVDTPISLYAATKRADELMSQSYAHLYGLAQTGLRFFTVYGPWGRPDMAVWLFTEAILEGRPVTLYNNGDMGRDFTYIDDIVDGILKVAAHSPPPDPAMGDAPHRIYNIGNNRPNRLRDLVTAIEEALDRKADIRTAPMQPGDMPETWADISTIQHDLGFTPRTTLREGVQAFVDWYRHHRALLNG
ncbi:NAD-dependent epimerase/dehydratase family protein [Yunchengibacter salinarum]|uniref:NAD-dependent epimerase/dehydratase family protein n=1 Tax=Yunchengibacter salinarum TaxID=3133399 RepID=UPI0035B671D0